MLLYLCATVAAVLAVVGYAAIRAGAAQDVTRLEALRELLRERYRAETDHD